MFFRPSGLNLLVENESTHTISCKGEKSFALLSFTHRYQTAIIFRQRQNDPRHKIMPLGFMR
jgi:hypothetical protein